MRVKQLLQQMPAGAVVTTAWLASRDVSADQARKLAGGGWLQRVGHGAYSRAGDSLSWESAVFALQAIGNSGLPRFWPGGLTALGLQGLSHYLPIGQEKLHLFGSGTARPPHWLMDSDWVGPVEFHVDKDLGADIKDSFVHYAPPGKAFGLQVSAPERAILEWIAVTPNELLFSSVLVDTFNGLNTLRPGLLQAMLESCGSVRTKRVFLLLARHAGHAWNSRLDRQRLDLGSGKRQLCPGGRLDREFQITVPTEFLHGA